MSWHYTAEKIQRLINDLSGSIVRESLPCEPFSLSRDGKPDSSIKAGDTIQAQNETLTLQGIVYSSASHGTATTCASR